MKRFMLACLLFLGGAAAALAGEWISDHDTNCQVWNPDPSPGEEIKWSGQCSNGKATGKGTLQWYLNGNPNGRYEGEYRDGHQNGKGVDTSANGDRYEGEYRDDDWNGKGVNTSANGDRCEGEYRDGYMNGKGVCTWASGSRHDGEYASGKRSGFGTLRLVRDDKAIQSWERNGQGNWIGTQYVVQGMFSDNNLVRSCASKADCKNKEREEYAQRERSNIEACNRLYPGKPVTLRYGQGQSLGPFYADAMIVGVGRGIASARVIGGAAYGSDGYGIGSVHEKSCMDF